MGEPLPELLTTEEMYRADAAAIRGGISGERLMENAGRAVADAVVARWSPRPVAVLCGPGNNGGDGFVAARLLRARGWPVRLASLGAVSGLKGDAAIHAARWTGAVETMTPAALDGASLVIDALFGAGLGRPLEGPPADLLAEAERRGLPIVAVDVPSGVDGSTGAVRGHAPRADLTVTFFRAKPGHFLLPGRLRCGELVVADIGIPAAVLDEVRPLCRLNGPALWLAGYPWPTAESHKYRRGHALVLGGGTMTGAARLAAMAALRTGAGLVTVAAPAKAWPVYAAALTSVIVAPVAGAGDWAGLLADPRRNAVLLGPGAGVSETLRRRVLAALEGERGVVLDADALTAFEGAPEALFDRTRGRPVVLTPHEGELARLFPAAAGPRLDRARAAAALAGAVVALKGADTVIAAPDGRAIVNATAPPELATGGTGDVLAGMVLGLLAQGMPAFDGTAAAVWLHGEAARGFGPGLIAEDLPSLLPGTFARLKGLAGAM